jgi:hypothetical protein
MTDCCEYRACIHGPNCPVRKQRIEATNKAFIERKRVADTDPYVETVGTVKALIAVIVVVTGITLIAFSLWRTT